MNFIQMVVPKYSDILLSLLNLFNRVDAINPDYPLIQPIAATVGNWIENCPGEALKNMKQL